MANSKLILAVAGSGKTYHLAEQLNTEDRNILITFTNRNVENIIREIKNQHGEVPSNTVVITYARFVYNWLIKPINPFLEIGDVTGKEIRGLDVYSVLERPWQDGKSNWRYINQNKYQHYLNNNDQLYINRMVDLFNKQIKPVQKLAFSRLEKYCDVLLIDESQDFRTKDYDLLLELSKLELPKTIGVGDYHQHSVSYTNQKLDRPFVKKKKNIPYEDYIQNEEKVSTIDTTTLVYSRRVPENVCMFIREKLKIEIYSKKENGEVILIESLEELDKVLRNRNITKILHKNSGAYTLAPVINWDYSKGDTYENSCVVLTNTFKDLFTEEFSIKGISQSEINKLYVALTRAKNNVYIVKRDLFARVEKDFKLE